jgi:hypothetical protein
MRPTLLFWIGLGLMILAFLSMASGQLRSEPIGEALPKLEVYSLLAIASFVGDISLTQHRKAK